MMGETFEVFRLRNPELRLHHLADVIPKTFCDDEKENEFGYCPYVVNHCGTSLEQVLKSGMKHLRR